MLDEGPMDRDLDAAITGALRRRAVHASFVSELAAELSDTSPQSLQQALRKLEESGSVMVFDHPAPDPHLAAADLRVVALHESEDVSVATEAAQAVWDQWLREFLASHRCT